MDEVNEVNDEEKYGKENFPVHGAGCDSPFYCYFSKIYTNEEMLLNGHSNNTEYAKNMYKCTFAKYLLKKYVLYAQLWIGITFEIHSPDIYKISNSNAECWFKIVKTDFPENQTNLKVARFVNILKTRVQAEYKELKYIIPGKNKGDNHTSKIDDMKNTNTVT